MHGLRELEPVIARAAVRISVGGLGSASIYPAEWRRSADYQRYVMPERSGYYLGARMTDAVFSTRGAEWAVGKRCGDFRDSQAAAALHDAAFFTRL
jgi:hypothetical protein